MVTWQVRKTLSRALVLTVCLGYGVVRPTIGSTWPRIVLLGGLYFVASAALDIASNVRPRLLLVLPVPTPPHRPVVPRGS